MMLIQGSINGRIPCGSYCIQNIATVPDDPGSFLYMVDYVDTAGVTIWRGHVVHRQSDPWYVLLSKATQEHVASANSEKE